MKINRVHAIIISAFLFAAIFYVLPVFAGPYRDYIPFISAFKALATSYPQLVSYESIGKTVLNEDILMFRIGNPAGGVVLFDGAIHGWESQGSELLYLYAQWLLTSGDSLANDILTRTCTLIVPAVNVDNYNTLRVNIHHVDLNRNFATDWQYGGSTDPTSDNYRGSSALSEPEAQALAGVFQARKPSAYVNIHDGGGGEILYASSYTNSTYRSSVISKINSMSAQRGATPYGNPIVISGPGEAISDAAKGGTRTSFLLEIGNGTRPLSEVNTLVLPRFIPIAVVLSQESESNVSNILFTDSFESGDFRSWDGNQTTGGETLSVTNRLSRQGVMSASFTAYGSSSSETAYIYKNLEPSATIFARGYFLATSFTATANYSRFYFTAFAASDQTVAMAGCLRSGNVTWWRLAVWNGTNWLLADSEASQFLNQWHRFELQWTQNSTDGYGKLYVDGKMVSSISGINTAMYGPVDSAKFGIAQSGGAKTAFYLDYVQLSRVSLGPLPIPEDLNQDFRIDMLDLSIAARSFGAVIGSAYWDPRADLNADSKIDMRDITTIAIHFGEKQV